MRIIIGEIVHELTAKIAADQVQRRTMLRRLLGLSARGLNDRRSA